MNQKGILTYRHYIVIALLVLAFFVGICVLGIQHSPIREKAAGELAAFKAQSVAEIRSGSSSTIGQTYPRTRVRLEVEGKTYHMTAGDDGFFQVSEPITAKARTQYTIQYHRGVLMAKQTGTIQKKTEIQSGEYHQGDTKITVAVTNLRQDDMVVVTRKNKKDQRCWTRVEADTKSRTFSFDTTELKENDVLNITVVGRWGQEIDQRTYLIK